VEEPLVGQGGSNPDTGPAVLGRAGGNLPVLRLGPLVFAQGEFVQRSQRQPDLVVSHIFVEEPLVDALGIDVLAHELVVFRPRQLVAAPGGVRGDNRLQQFPPRQRLECLQIDTDQTQQGGLVAGVGLQDLVISQGGQVELLVGEQRVAQILAHPLGLGPLTSQFRQDFEGLRAIAHAGQGTDLVRQEFRVAGLFLQQCLEERQRLGGPFQVDQQGREGAREFFVPGPHVCQVLVEDLEGVRDVVVEDVGLGQLGGDVPRVPFLLQRRHQDGDGQFVVLVEDSHVREGEAQLDVIGFLGEKLLVFLQRLAQPASLHQDTGVFLAQGEIAAAEPLEILFVARQGQVPVTLADGVARSGQKNGPLPVRFVTRGRHLLRCLVGLWARLVLGSDRPGRRGLLQCLLNEIVLGSQRPFRPAGGRRRGRRR